MVRPTQVRALVTEALRQGAGTVEEVRRKIAAMPAAELRRFGVGEAAGSATRSADALGDVIRRIDGQVRRVARDLLSQTPGTEGDKSPR